MNKKISSLALMFSITSAFAGIACTTSPSSDDASLDAAIADGKADGNSAARYTRKSKPTNTKLAALATTIEKYGDPYAGTYRFNKVTDEGTSATSRMKRVKEVMLRYQCGFFDDEIDLTRPSGSAADKASLVSGDLDFGDNAPNFSESAYTAKATVAFGDSTLDVMSGNAAGNNTVGEVMGLYDEKNNEIYYYGFTNCGSDN